MSLPAPGAARPTAAAVAACPKVARLARRDWQSSGGAREQLGRYAHAAETIKDQAASFIFEAKEFADLEGQHFKGCAGRF